MKPKNPPQAEARPLQLFQSRLDSQINLDHPLCQLAERIDWERFDDAYAPLYCEDNDAPTLPTRLMVALEYLKYTYHLSDDGHTFSALLVGAETITKVDIAEANVEKGYRGQHLSCKDRGHATFTLLKQSMDSWMAWGLETLLTKVL